MNVSSRNSLHRWLSAWGQAPNSKGPIVRPPQSRPLFAATEPLESSHPTVRQLTRRSSACIGIRLRLVDSNHRSAPGRTGCLTHSRPAEDVLTAADRRRHRQHGQRNGVDRNTPLVQGNFRHRLADRGGSRRCGRWRRHTVRLDTLANASVDRLVDASPNGQGG